jgi:hypothetical protein
MPLDIGNGGVTDDMHVPGVAYFNQAGATVGTQKSTRIHGRASTLGDVVGDDIPVDQPIPVMTMIPLLCLTGTTNFLATRNLTTITRMGTFPMVLFWICTRKGKSCDQIDMVWTGFLAQRRYI